MKTVQILFKFIFAFVVISPFAAQAGYRVIVRESDFRSYDISEITSKGTVRTMPNGDVIIAGTERSAVIPREALQSANLTGPEIWNALEKYEDSPEAERVLLSINLTKKSVQLNFNSPYQGQR